MNLLAKSKEEVFFSDICTDLCAGMCCDPWWGIVSFPVRKDNGLSGLKAFKSSMVNAVKEREERIRSNYRTIERNPRALFDSPLIYNLSIEEVKTSGHSMIITIRAMFAFRCLFLTSANSCDIHPAITGAGDIRPPHCAYMGTLNATYGDKGFCRIIHSAAVPGAEQADIITAKEAEAEASKKYFDEGYDSIENAVDVFITELTDYIAKNAPQLLPRRATAQKTGRNDPCTCGSGKKFKRCCGR